MASYTEYEKQALEQAGKDSANYAKTATSVSDDVKAQIQSAIDKANAANSQASGNTIQKTNSAYGNMINANDINNAIIRRSVANALSGLGIQDEAPNRTQSVALNTAKGNTDQAIAEKQQRAVDALSSLADAYKAKSDAYQDTTAAGLDNSLANAILNQKSKGEQSALSSAASGYASGTKAESDNAAKVQNAQNSLNKVAAAAQAFNQKLQDESNADAVSNSLSLSKQKAQDVAELMKTKTDSSGNATEGMSFDDAWNAVNGINTAAQQQAQAEQEAVKAGPTQLESFAPKKPSSIDYFVNDYVNGGSDKVNKWNDYVGSENQQGNYMDAILSKIGSTNQTAINKMSDSSMDKYIDDVISSTNDKTGYYLTDENKNIVAQKAKDILSSKKKPGSSLWDQVMYYFGGGI